MKCPYCLEKTNQRQTITALLSLKTEDVSGEAETAEEANRKETGSDFLFLGRQPSREFHLFERDFHFPSHVVHFMI